MGTASIYCASDTRNFVGLVALLNSLRLRGHEEELIVLDAGLGDAELTMLEGHARVMPLRDDVSPYFRKYALPRTQAAVHVIVDADVIATRPLTDLIDLAASGSIVAFADGLVDRFRPEWGELLGLGQLEPRPYVNAGVLAVPAEAVHILDAVLECEAAVDFSETLCGGGPPDSPFLHNDQDLLNAILASRGAPELVVLEHRLAPHPPFRGLVAVDEQGLSCRYHDGVQPYVLHHVLGKPWAAHTRINMYSRLLPRLVLAPDVELRLRPDQVPRRLRGTRVAAAVRLASSGRASLREQRARLRLRGRMSDMVLRRPRPQSSRRGRPRPLPARPTRWSDGESQR
jgi:hypothetical protein